MTINIKKFNTEELKERRDTAVTMKYNGKVCSVKGVFSYGKEIHLIDSNGNKFNTNIKNVELIKYGKGIQFN